MRRSCWSRAGRCLLCFRSSEFVFSLALCVRDMVSSFDFFFILLFFWVSLKGCKVSGSIRTLRDFSSHGNLAYAKRGICLQTDGHRHSQTQPFVLHSGEQEAYTFFCLGGSQYLTCNIYFSSSSFFLFLLQEIISTVCQRQLLTHG